MSKVKSSYNVYDAKNSLSELIDRIQEGEEIIIMKRGQPVAKLVPLEKEKVRLGWGKGELLKGWDKPLDDFEDYT